MEKRKEEGKYSFTAVYFTVYLIQTQHSANNTRKAKAEHYNETVQNVKLNLHLHMKGNCLGAHPEKSTNPVWSKNKPQE